MSKSKSAIEKKDIFFYESKVNDMQDRAQSIPPRQLLSVQIMAEIRLMSVKREGDI